MLKMVFRQNLLHFVSLIIFIDGLYLDNDFRTCFLSFFYFYRCCYCFVGVVIVVSFFFSFCCFIILYIIIIIIIISSSSSSSSIYSLNLILFFVAMLGSFLLSYLAVLFLMFLMYAYHFMLLLMSEILILCSL